MQITTNKLALLAFNRIFGIGPNTVAALWKKWPDLFELFHWDRSQFVHSGLPQALAEAILQFDTDSLDADLEWSTASSSHHILTMADDNYPALLQETPASPLVLYAVGSLSCLALNKIAMVGTRKPSCVGIETAWQFAADFARSGISVVSGLALGIDAQAHLGCIAAGGATIAVLGSGINNIYPYRHRELAASITHNGLLISEFPLNTPPNARHFPRRNRIISGLSLATLVVEAALKSGSLITAKLAIEQNREVFAIPGSIHSPESRGCNYLLQQGAILITSAQELLQELHLFSTIDNKINVNKLACKNQYLVKCIGFEVTTVDQIVARSGLNLSTVLHQLSELELNGNVSAVCGGYVRC